MASRLEIADLNSIGICHEGSEKGGHFHFPLIISDWLFLFNPAQAGHTVQVDCSDSEVAAGGSTSV